MTETGKVLHVLIPCYNPDPGWVYLISDKIIEFSRVTGEMKLKVTIINDGSDSETINNEFRLLETRIPEIQIISYQHNKGKGFALRKGLQYAEGDYFIYTDIDFPYTLESMAAMTRDLMDGYDIVIGVRQNEYYQKLPPRRVFVSKLLKFLTRNIFRLPVSDTQCGLKGFNNAGKKIFMQTRVNRFLFDMEFLKLAAKRKSLKIKPVLVQSRPGISFSHMHLGVLLRESFNLAWILVK